MGKKNNVYRVALLVAGAMPVNVTIKLGDPSDAEAVDKWLEEQIDNSVFAAIGGPNDIELD